MLFQTNYMHGSNTYQLTEETFSFISIRHDEESDSNSDEEESEEEESHVAKSLRQAAEAMSIQNPKKEKKKKRKEMLLTLHERKQAHFLEKVPRIVFVVFLMHG